MVKSRSSRLEVLYRFYHRQYDKAMLEMYVDAVSVLTDAEFDSALKLGPGVWKFGMPTPEQFIEAVYVEAKAPSCDKCANGFVADPERGRRAVRRCECQKQSANAHGKGKL